MNEKNFLTVTKGGTLEGKVSTLKRNYWNKKTNMNEWNKHE